MLPNAAEAARMREWCRNCADYWLNWPMWLSDILAPILLLFIPVLYVLTFFLLTNAIWAYLISYRWASLWLASYGHYVVQTFRWWVTISCAVIQILQGRYATALFTMCWLLIHIAVCMVMPSNNKEIVRAFYAQSIGYRLK